MKDNNIKNFIEKAREGGYDPGRTMTVSGVLLDPLCWQAVGKVSDWHEKESRIIGPVPKNCSCYKTYMHRFLDLLIEGKDINSALAEILK